MSNRFVDEQRVLKEIEASLSLYETIIPVSARKPVYYASAALTTGTPLYDAMEHYGVKSRGELDQINPQIYQDLKTQNILEGINFGEYVREQTGSLVIVPGKFFMPGWLQVHYMSFWEQVISRFSHRLTFTEDWLSSGQTAELLIGLRYDRPLFGKDLQKLDVNNAIRDIANGIERILRIGADATAQINLYRDIRLFAAKPQQTFVALS